MRCISCIGFGTPKEDRFCRGDSCIESNLVQEAVWHFWHPDEIILCISDPMHAPLAAECESRGLLVNKLWIPDGNTDNDIWDIFTLMGSCTEEGEEILIDITGGSHALSFIISHVAIYLRQVKKVRIIGIIYATAPDEYGLRHFVDLKHLMSVSDWINGVNALTSYSDAEPIRNLMTGLQAGIHKANNEQSPPTHLSGWSHLLETFTGATRLARPVDALYAGYGIARDLPVIREEVTRFAPSLVPVLDDMQIIAEMASPPPKDGLSVDYLMLQHRLIRYQIEKGLFVQAVSLSREWLISGVILKLGLGKSWLDANCRHIVSRTLTGIALTYQKKYSENTLYTTTLLAEKNVTEIVQIWERVSDLRNDLAHCGMNERDESLKSIMRRTMRLPKELRDFGEISGLI